MNCFVCVIAICAVAVVGSPEDDGKWHPKKYGTGRYDRPPDEGKYIHIPNPYKHVHIPYDGGYGPYTHQDVPYEPYEGQASENEEIYKYVLTGSQDLPYYKPGYYRNNGIKILNQKHNYHEDRYDFNFETENKIRQKENAVLKNPNTIDEGIESEGFYEYIGPDGFLYRVEYKAGTEGFRPKVKRIETPYSGKWVLEKVKKNKN